LPGSSAQLSTFPREELPTFPGAELPTFPREEARRRCT